jgi:TonB family protein
MRIAQVLAVVALSQGAAAGAYAGQEQIYRPGNGVTAPVAEKRVRPEYTAAARAAGVEGVMTLECVVRADGTVSDAEIVKSLHPSLNEEALRALAEWRFKPGTKDGIAVPVRVEIEMSFSLQEPEEPFRGPAVDSPEVFRLGNGVTEPKLVRSFGAHYPPMAARDRAQGMVKMKCVVLPDGTVGDVKVTQRVHPDLDRTSVRTLRQWTFTPGMKDGVAVPVQIDVDMSFTLGKR